MNINKYKWVVPLSGSLAKVAQMADLNTTYDRKSIRRISEVLPQFQPCSPVRDTTRHSNPATQSGDTPTPLGDTRSPEGTSLCEFLSYYREGKEFYDQLLLRIDRSIDSTNDFVTRIENIINNNNNNIELVPDKYKQILSVETPITAADISQLRNQFHSRVQSELDQKRGLVHTSEKRGQHLSSRRKQLTDLTEYIDSINKTLGAREEDPMLLFRRLKEQNGT